MSNAILKGNASGTGSVTLESPNTNSDRTIALPDSDGTAMVSGNMPAFSAYVATTQSITTSTQTKVAFNTKVFDTANCYDNTTNYRFTPNVAGYYQISTGIDFSPTASQTRAFIAIYKNGSEYARPFDTNGSSIYAANGSVLIYCNGSTDYIEVYCQINGTSPGFGGGSRFTWITGSMVRAA